MLWKKGVKLMYLSPYSPDFNFIEESFSYMKSVFWSNGVQFHAAVDTKDETVVTKFISDTLLAVTSEQARGWFQHSNYV